LKKRCSYKIEKVYSNFTENRHFRKLLGITEEGQVGALEERKVERTKRRGLKGTLKGTLLGPQKGPHAGHRGSERSNGNRYPH
jgi:hypothetical protein